MHMGLTAAVAENNVSNDEPLQLSDNFWAPFGIACAAINGKGNAEAVFLNGGIFDMSAGEPMKLYTATGLSSTVWGVGDPGLTYYIDTNFIASVTTGVFDGNDLGREQFVFIIGFNEQGNLSTHTYDNYWYKIGIIGGKDYNDTMVDGQITQTGTAQNYYSNNLGTWQSGYGNGYLIEDHGDNPDAREGDPAERLNCFAVAIDRDIDDGVTAKYNSKYYAYSDPTVQAVLQAAPYFDELGGYGNFDDGATSYSITTSYSYGEGTETTHSVSAGAWFDMEYGLVAGFTLNVETGYQGEFTSSFENSLTTSYTDIFTAGAEDTVVLQRTPVFIYCYDIMNPDGTWPTRDPNDADPNILNDKSYMNKGSIQVSVPKEPRYYSMSVDSYNYFVAYYNEQIKSLNQDIADDSNKIHELKPIDENSGQAAATLGNSGNSFGYQNQATEGTILTSKSYELGYNAGSVTSEWSQEESETVGKSTTHGFYFGLSVGGGYKGAMSEIWGGASISYEYNRGSSSYETNTNATGTSGTVANIYDRALEQEMGISRETSSQYKFIWQFGQAMLDLNSEPGTDTPMLLYRLTGLKAPPVPVTDLQAEQQGAKRYSLTWSRPEVPADRMPFNKEIDGFNVYAITEDGEQIKLNDTLVTDTTFDVEVLESNTAYTFIVTAVHVADTGVEQESVPSNQVDVLTDRRHYTLNLASDSNGTISAIVSGREINETGSVPEESVVYLKAQADEGYLVTGFTIQQGEQEQNIAASGSSAEYDFVLRGDTTVTVHTARIVESSNLTFGTKADDAAFGTVYAFDAHTDIQIPSSPVTVNTDSVRLVAQPADGYILRAWEIDGVEMPANGATELNFIPTQTEHTIYALFVPADAQEMWSTVTVEPSVGGSVQVSQSGEILTPDEHGQISIYRGSSVTLTAQPDTYYDFSNWNGALKNYGDTREIMVLVEDDLTVSASFTPLFQYTITFGETPAGAGTVTATAVGRAVHSGENLAPGTDVDFYARANGNNRLDKWAVTVSGITDYITQDGLVTESQYTLENLLGNAQVEARFEQIEYYKITYPNLENGTILVTDANGDLIASGDSVQYGTMVVISAEPNRGYQLDSLTVNGNDFKSGNTITVDQELEVAATFLWQSSDGSSTSGGGGSTSGGGSSTSGGGGSTSGGSGSTSGGSGSISGGGDDIDEPAEAPADAPAEDDVQTIEMPFADVVEDTWYTNAVQYVYEKGIMNGVSTTEFGPNITTSRAMIVTMLYRLEGEPAADASSFTDVASDAYYADAVAWAETNNIVYGVSDTQFAPDDVITREQMAAILYRYAQYKGYDMQVGSMSLSEYIDAAQIGAYAGTAMQWANAKGLIAGVSANELDPQGSATRAQVATILMRFCEDIAQ